MAFTGLQDYAPVLAALATMQSNVDRSQKSQAHEYLEKFQKSVRSRLPPTNDIYETD